MTNEELLAKVKFDDKGLVAAVRRITKMGPFWCWPIWIKSHCWELETRDVVLVPFAQNFVAQRDTSGHTKVKELYYDCDVDAF